MNVVERIATFNAGRDPRRLAMKVAKMRSSPFEFLRGTCHLFAELLGRSDLPDSPPAWACGDLHFENFGRYKADDRLVHFDINDFDETALASASWNLVRFLASLRTAARNLSLPDHEADTLRRAFVDRYADALASGKARWVERETATGAVADLLGQLQERRRAEFLRKRTTGRGAKLALRVNSGKALPTTPDQKVRIRAFMETFAKAQLQPAFFKVIDVVDRIAGTCSLGTERYVVFIRDLGTPGRDYLLDLKRAAASSLLPHVPVPQPRWRNEAVRIATLQQRMQAASMAFLHAVTLGRDAFILRELQTGEDRVALDRARDSLDRFREVIHTMADVVAWAPLRSAGRQGSANADALEAFGAARAWRRPLVAASRRVATHVVADRQSFRAASEMPSP